MHKCARMSWEFGGNELVKRMLTETFEEVHKEDSHDIHLIET